MRKETDNNLTRRFECADFEAVLSGFLDGVIASDVAHEAEVHLTGCSRCRSILESAEAIDGDVRTSMLGLEHWSAALEDRIFMAAIGTDAVVKPHSRRRLVFAAWTGWAAAAMLLMGVGLSWQLGWLGAPSSPSETTLAGGKAASSPLGDSAPMDDESTISSGSIAASDPADVVENDSDDLNPTFATVDFIPPVGSDRLGDSLAVLSPAPERDSPVELASHDSLLAQELPEHHDFWDAVAEHQARTNMPAIADGERRLLHVVDQPRFDDSARYRRDGWSTWMPGISRTQVVLAVDMEGERRAREQLDGEAGEVLHQASILLTVLEQAEAESFGDVRLVQQALESDDVLERLATARSQLTQPESVELVNMAWSVLEWTNGQLDQGELVLVRDSIAENDLSRRMERLSDQYWN